MKFATLILLLLSLFFAMLLLAEPILVYANGTACPPKTICIDNPIKYEKIEDILGAIADFLAFIAIPLGIIIVVWGGIQIMAAGGSEEKVTKGKKTIMWAVIGVGIVLLVKFIVGFVQEILGGA